MTDKYLLNIYIAAPGTPLKEDGTSLPGHMYYGLQHGNEAFSFGLAPAKHGEMNGPGKVYTDDVSNYQNPRYMRTLEVSKEQYDKLKEFGQDPSKAGFDTYYKDARNNCVDFTWGALNYAAIHKTDPKIIGYDRAPIYSAHERVPSVRHEGSLKPLHNIDDVQSIQAPIPNSALNKEHFNPMPARNWKQKLLSDNEIENPDQQHPLVKQAMSGVEKLPNDSFKTQQERQNAGAALGAKAAVEGFTHIDHVLQGADRKNIFAVQGALNDPAHQRTHVNSEVAANTAVTESLRQIQSDVQRHVEQTQLQSQQQDQPKRALV